MIAESPAIGWYEDFFSGEALELWRRAIPAENTEQEFEFLCDALEAPENGRLLDLPCGNGRLSLPLALSGFKVTGVDSCAEFLTEARQSADKNKTKVNYVQGDMRRLSFKEKFDGAFCMGNSFGYFDYAGSLEFIQSLSKNLKPGAKFVLDSVMAAESFMVNAGEREWVQVGDMLMLTENRYNCRLSCVETTYTFIRNGNEEQRLAVHWIFTAGEICRMLEQAGFDILDQLCSTEFEPFYLGAERLLLIAQKS